MKRIGFDEFKKRAIEIHGEKYHYNESSYNGMANKIEITCPIHGTFLQKARLHINGCGCPKCAIEQSSEKQKFKQDYIIKRFMEIHNSFYSYEKFKYNGMNKKSVVTCPIHGDFEIMPSKHINGRGCSKCSGKSRLTTEEFINNAKSVHGDKYDYSKVDYINAITKVCIICPIHGEFWQIPHNHVNGEQGCPICNFSHLESKVKKFLDGHNIKYEFQKKFPWLGRKSLDFYLPDYNLAIECQGKQHFGLGGWNNKDALKSILERDKIKKRLCIENNLNIIYFSDKKYRNDVLTDVNDILNVLKK